MVELQFPVKVMEPVRVEDVLKSIIGHQASRSPITHDGRSLISTPLFWEEVVQGVNPDDFHLRSLRERLKKIGDLSTVMTQTNDFSPILHYFT